VSQPAVTAHIRGLEESLGIKLFRKRGRRRALTENGALLLRYTHEVFALERTIEETIREVRELEGGLLKIGTSRTYAQRLMPELMTRFHAAFPKVRMVLDEGSSFDMSRAVLELRNELAIIARPAGFDGVCFVPFRRERIVLFASARHPLAESEGIEFAQLENELVIMREEGSGIQSLIRRCFAERGLTPNVLVETGNVEFIKEMVERGDAVSFLVETSIAAEIERGVIKAIPIVDQELALDVSIAYLEEAQLSPAAAAFLEMLLQEVNGEGATDREVGGTPTATS